MEFYINLVCLPDFEEDFGGDLSREIMEKEFKLNWAHQVPHWNLLSDEGISFFKGVRNQVWLRP